MPQATPAHLRCPYYSISKADHCERFAQLKIRCGSTQPLTTAPGRTTESRTTVVSTLRDAWPPITPYGFITISTAMVFSTSVSVLRQVAPSQPTALGSLAPKSYRWALERTRFVLSRLTVLGSPLRLPLRCRYVWIPPGIWLLARPDCWKPIKSHWTTISSRRWFDPASVWIYRPPP